MEVIVFGGSGYIGGSMIPFLIQDGHTVTVFDNLSFGRAALLPWLDHERFRFIEGDIRDIEAVSRALKGQRAAILLASLVGEAACDRDPEKTVAVNYLASWNAFRAARHHGLERFIFTSTDSCYGAQEKISLTEEAPLKPLSLYAALKARVEEEILAEIPTPGFHPTVLRLATIYGLAPRMRFDLVLNLLVREAVAGSGAKIFSGEQWRPLVHVRDAARAFALTLAADPALVSGQIFNVGSNHQNVQFKDLGRLLLSVIPEAKVETVPQPPDLRDYNVNFDKISRVLGFKPAYEPEDGFKEIKKALESGTLGDPYSPIYRNS